MQFNRWLPVLMVAIGAVALFPGAAPAQVTPQVTAALAAGSYFPLDVGNQWVFRMEDRLGTGAYEMWRVDRTQSVGGKTYAVFGIYSGSTLYGEYFFRTDEQGRILLLSGDTEKLFLDTRPGAQQGIIELTGGAAASHSEAGDFADSRTYINHIDVLSSETGTLARGVGLLTSTRNLLTGSSGGLLSKRILVEAVVGGGTLRFGAPTGGLRLSLDDLSPDLSSRKATNCALPCYFAACGLGGGQPDPPGTYKPCARARVGAENWPVNASRAVRIRLLSPEGAVLVERDITLPGGTGENSVSTQIPLFIGANQPYPPGAYRLTAATDDGSLQSSVAVQIR